MQGRFSEPLPSQLVWLASATGAVAAFDEPVTPRADVVANPPISKPMTIIIVAVSRFMKVILPRTEKRPRRLVGWSRAA